VKSPQSKLPENGSLNSNVSEVRLPATAPEAESKDYHSGDDRDLPHLPTSRERDLTAVPSTVDYSG